MSLIADLKFVAEIWATTTGRSKSRLATIVVNDGKFFDRLDGGAGCTVATLERFMAYFAITENWPASSLPDEVADRVRAFGTERQSACQE